MPLEATMIIIDNSEYMRNGDYTPTRFAAQADAVNVVFQTKIDSNPENTVGIMSMAGKSPEVLVTHTKEIGHILSGLHTASTKISGSIDVPTSLAVAQLALKHRENKNLRQRIIVFASSPLESDTDTMVRLAKKLKKNNVAVDLVLFGDAIGEEGGEGVGRAFVEGVSSGDNSNIVVIPPGAHLLSDALIASPILSADRSASIPEALGGTGAGDEAGAGPSAGNEFEFGVDPSLDPELAMALRMSMQEAQAREAAAAATTSTSTTTASATTDAPATGPAPGTTVPSQGGTIPADPTDDEEERMLQEAIALSKGDGAAGPAPSADEDEDEDEDDDEEDEDGDVEMEDEEEDGEEEDDDDEEEEDEDEDDEDIARAIAMSMEKPDEKKK